MLGFIKKDLAMIKSNFKLLGILVVLYTVMGFIGEMDISFILPFISVMIMMSTFSYDDLNKWNAYAVTLPNGRKNSVKAKYVTTLLMILVVMVITTILALLITYNNSKIFAYEKVLFTMLGNVFGTLLVLDIMYPIIYKLGIEKARIAIFVIVFGIIIVGGLIVNFIDLSNFFNVLSFLNKYIVLILVLSFIIMLYISYKLSLKFNLNKEY